jgi:hypothetical protein
MRRAGDPPLPGLLGADLVDLPRLREPELFGVQIRKSER